MPTTQHIDRALNAAQTARFYGDLVGTMIQFYVVTGDPAQLETLIDTARRAARWAIHAQAIGWPPFSPNADDYGREPMAGILDY